MISQRSYRNTATDTGNKTVVSNDASEALCSNRAMTNQTTASPTTINGYSTMSAPPAAATPLPPLR